MNDDPADLDGDGEFDALDIEIMNNPGKREPPGCGLFLLLFFLLISSLAVVVGP